MNFRLTAAGTRKASIPNALLDRLGKPMAEANSLCIPPASYGHPMVSPVMAW